MKKILIILALFSALGCATVEKNSIESNPPLTSIFWTNNYDGDFKNHNEIETVPKPTRQHFPMIPSKFRFKNIKGILRTIIIVDPKGIPIHMLECESNDESFAKEFVKVYKRWRFLPTKVGDQAVFVAVEIELEFDCKNRMINHRFLSNINQQ